MVRPPGEKRGICCAVLLAVALLTLLGVPGRPAAAWTATTERAILARALGTMPRPLRLVLTRHRGELYRAADTIPGSRPPLEPGLIVSECEKAVRMIRQRQPYALTARQLGRVGVLAAATADPFLAEAGTGQPAPAYSGFQLYSERMLHLIPFVIADGEERARRDLLDHRTDPDAYLRSALRLSAGYRLDLEAHVPGNTEGIEPWAGFDARSTPFAVSSVSVSRAACRVSALWQWIWQQAGGGVPGRLSE